jgi:small subunit ribosomal protein S1
VVNPADLFKKGDEIEAVVLNIDPVEQRASLSRKRALPGGPPGARRRPLPTRRPPMVAARPTATAAVVAVGANRYGRGNRGQSGGGGRRRDGFDYDYGGGGGLLRERRRGGGK